MTPGSIWTICRVEALEAAPAPAPAATAAARGQHHQRRTAKAAADKAAQETDGTGQR